MKAFLHKYGFLLAVIIALSVITCCNLPLGLTALQFTGKNFLNFLFMLTPIFILIGLLDTWVDRNTMIKIMGEKSGIKGVFIALCMGVITAVPVYALFPIANVLLKKGCKIFNVMIFFCSSAGIRIPLLLFEVSSFGWELTLLRFALNLIVVFVMAYIIEKILSEKDKIAIHENANRTK